MDALNFSYLILKADPQQNTYSNQNQTKASIKYTRRRGESVFKSLY